jgi:hypothetical protein
MRSLSVGLMRIRQCVIVIVLAVLTACSGGASGYGRDTQGAFMETCVHKEQQPEQICRCTYDEITRRIPFDRYVEIDKELQKDPDAVPDEILSIVSDCGSRLSESGSSTSSSSSNNASS